MQTVYIVSSGSYYRPVETPSGKAGWVGEVTFWFPPSFEGEKFPNITKTFNNQNEADAFVEEELFKFFHDEEYKFLDYGTKMLSRSIFTGNGDETEIEP